jgi:hypothetical protein
MNLQGRDLTFDPSGALMTGQDVATLQTALGQLGFTIDSNEKSHQSFGQTTHDAVVKFQTDHRLSANGTVDAATVAAINRDLDAITYTVSGRVASEVSAAVSGLQVQLIDKNIGPDSAPLDTTTTDKQGQYHFSVIIPQATLQANRKTQPDFQVRVLSSRVIVASSEVRYQANKSETLDVLIPADAKALPSEHEVLTGAIADHFGGRLQDLKETSGQQDITYLANKTGWDARAVALAALADKFSSGSSTTAGAPTIPQPFFYALFRAGLPADDNVIYHTDADTLQQVWKQAADQGIIPSSSVDRIPTITSQFQATSAQRLLSGPALAGVSTVKDLLTVSGLDDGQQQTLAKLYAANRSDLRAFWNSVSTTSTLGNVTANRLQVNGKLSFLTINNAPLMNKIHAAAGTSGVTDPAQLAQLGFHRPDAWTRLLTSDVPLPKEVPGSTSDAQRANYAIHLAAHVRLSYPTASVAQMVASAVLPLSNASSDVVKGVSDFLSTNQARFSIAAEPVERFIKRSQLKVPAETVQHVKRLQRLYQITPGDDAMAALLKRGINSSRDVIRHGKSNFVKAFTKDLGGDDQAAFVYDRAQQVHAAVLNMALGYLHARSVPPIGAHSAPRVLDPTPANTGDILATANLETLFGSMDFCGCEECQSILSPAAYLVDLLQFLNSDSDTWATFVTNWKQDHAGVPYPFGDQASFDAFKAQWNATHPGQPVPSTEISPFDVLMSRRPDIQHLPLTCENTNTPLPYIDLVNETMEYFIANQKQTLSLSDYTGHDTGDVASEDLLASPQFVMDSAYSILRNERFPDPLPFHQPLENLRRYFDKFEVPLPLAMERLRTSDDLERSGTTSYGWRDILMEELSLSRAEHDNLTNSAIVPLWQLYGFPSGTADPAVIDGLSKARDFARRCAITYDDLVSILRTRFINPSRDLIPKLERLGVSFAVLSALKTNNNQTTDQQFDALLAAMALPPDPAEYGGDIKGWIKDNANYSRIMGLITLAIPGRPWAGSQSRSRGDCVLPTKPQLGSTLFHKCSTAGVSAASEPLWSTTPGITTPDGTVIWTCQDAASCASFGDLMLRHSDPAQSNAPLTAAEFIRLARFIRLWKKLGWSIEQTDAALCAYFRADLAQLQSTDIDTPAKLDTGFLTLLPRLGIAFRVIEALGLNVKRDLLSLLAVWSDIGTHGTTALYRQMFLNPALLKQDKLFDDNGFGEFLTDPTQRLALHVQALRSALGLTGDEYDRILEALGFDGTTTLSIPNVSAIFRRGWLARKLKLSVRELLLLVQVTGLDPFAPPEPTSPAIMRLIALVQALKDRSLSTSAALYLIWNQDLSGKSAPAFTQVASLARTLRLGLASAASEFTITDDPEGSSAQALFSKVYGADAASFFFGLLDGTFSVDVDFGDPDGTLAAGPVRTAIDAASGKNESGLPRLGYNTFRKRLSYTGQLSATTRDALKQASGTPATSPFSKAVDDLFTQNQAAIKPFFARFPELQKPHDDFIADSDPAHTVALKRSILLGKILPEIVQRRKTQQALQIACASANVDAALTETLLNPTGSFPFHAVGQSAQPAVTDMLGLEVQGLSVRFFASGSPQGPSIAAPPIAADLDYAPPSPAASNPLPANPTAGAAIDGIWTGFIEAPENGFFSFLIKADPGATVSLSFGGGPMPLGPDSIDPTLLCNTRPINLQAGSLTAIALTVQNVRNVMQLQWEWQPKGQGRAVIPPGFLYPESPFNSFAATYTRFLKAASLASGLSLTASELAFLAAQPDVQIKNDAWLNALSATPDPAPVAASELLKPLELLLHYAQCKAELSPGDESLLSALVDPAAATAHQDSLLFSITGWDQASLNNFLTQFKGTIADLSNPEKFRRIHDAFSLAQTMGISAAELIGAATNEPTGDTVRNLQAALSARYDPSAWRDVVHPINDEMRSLQRNALVAYILHQMRANPESAQIDTPDKLYEFFLMDVQMEPCMQTSRIRQALSSVQLFIERCLLSLEPRVSPVAINAKQWEWMKRYRVWEAFRRVYAYAANWADGELRDDKSPFYKELESELMQSDLTEESAAAALMKYLNKLEEVAKLEASGVYHVPADPATRSGEVNHLISRTAGAKRKYYYRRQESGYWTAWEETKLDIEDNPVLPVVWNDRLFLFWVRILQSGPDKVNAPLPAGRDLTSLKTSDINTTPPTFTVKALLSWSEYVNGKWQPARSSAPSGALKIGGFALNAFDRSQLDLAALPWTNQALRVIVIYNCVGTSFFLHNSQSSPELRESKKEPHFTPKRVIDTSSEALMKVCYSDSGLVHLVLGSTISDRAIQPNHPVDAEPWDPPYFYEDGRYVFHVTTSKRLRLIPLWNDIGIQPALARPQLEIPHVVLKPTGLTADVAAPLTAQPGFGVVTPSPVQRFVSDDAYIHQGLGNFGTVPYGDANIGLSGSQLKPIRSR